MTINIQLPKESERLLVALHIKGKQTNHESEGTKTLHDHEGQQQTGRNDSKHRARYSPHARDDKETRVGNAHTSLEKSRGQRRSTRPPNLPDVLSFSCAKRQVHAMQFLIYASVFAGFFIGAAFMIALETLGFYTLVKLPPRPRTKPFAKFLPIHLPQKLLRLVQPGNWSKQRGFLIVANLLAQFLFREWKDSIFLRRLLLSAISKGLQEAQRGAAGKIFERIQLREFDLNSDFITFTKISVDDVILHDTWKTLEEVDIFISLDYAGGVTLAVDAELIIGGVASLSVKVNHFSAKSRLQFSRKPYTHWSFAFYEEPKIVISVESSLQGQSFPQIANIITSTIKRTLRNKHTIPSYKIRIKPFILLPDLRIAPPLQEKVSHSGKLEVTVVECSRLVLCEGSFQLYCMVSIEDSQWINVDNIVGTSWIPIELEINKERGHATGVELKEKLIEGRFRECVVVDTIAPNSPFAAGGLVEGDLVVSIKGTDVTDIKQAYKLLAKHGEKVTMKVERKSEFKWHKQAALEQQPQAHKTGDQTGPAPGATATEETKTKSTFVTTKTTLATLLGGQKTKKIGDSEDIQTRAKSRNQPIERTQFVLSTRDPVFLEKFTMEIKNNLKFINVGIFSKGQIISLHGMKKRPSDTMLAYNSIPLTYVLDECQKTTQGFFGPVIKLLCPEFQQLPKDLIKYSTLNGFDPRLCYGDITLHFVFKGEYKFKGGPQQEVEEEHDLMGLESSWSSTMKTQASKNLTHVFEDVALKKIVVCKYCDNRIWLGYGCRCKECNMIVHNKCHPLAQQKTLCKQYVHIMRWHHVTP
ncbi:uncharacterized protein LOC142578974 [Dermacentor variabilis]|uniref:uncharacterized protein LOC142578974 n=1 Tax=Dermacentor variabilis TaxID=34621 RepID=UPI003F5AE3FB